MTHKEQIIDDTDNPSVPFKYDIAYYGADLDIKSLVQRIRQEKIIIHDFQRKFVWKISNSSRFIESILLGFPIPGIFLAQEKDKYFVIDGQQRLKSLFFFYEGLFNKQQVFQLKDVVKEYVGLTYEDLLESDKRNLDNAVMHATIVTQENHKKNDTSIYYVYERLNGQCLSPQEIRCVVYHGKLVELVNSLNEYPNWRLIVGEKSPKLKDQELIMRFLAMYFSSQEYSPPMLHFINVFTKLHQNPSSQFINEAKKTFIKVIDAFWEALGKKAFRGTASALNAATFDSMMYGLAHRIKMGNVPKSEQIAKVHNSLLANSDYIKATMQLTANVALRLTKAKDGFAKI